MSRTELLKDLKERLSDIIAEISDEFHEVELSRNESDHWNDIECTLNEQVGELEYLFASMDAADEQDHYDEDGNELGDFDEPAADGSIW